MTQLGSRVQKAGEVVLIAVWFGLLTGVIQVLIEGITRHGFDRFTWSSRDVIWMAPTGHAILFPLLGVPLVLLAFFFPKQLPFGWVVGSFAFLGAYSLLLPYLQIARYAIVLIGLGIGVRTGQLMGREPARWSPRLHRMGIALLLGVVLLGVGVRGRRALVERRGSSLAAGSAPNVLLIILDTVRAASLSVYGYPRPTTPEIARWADRGVVFDRAFSTAPWTLPSHGTIFTGEYPEHIIGDWVTPLHLSDNTLASTLRERGYATGGFIANMIYTTHQSGLAAGFNYYDDHRVSLRQIILNSSLGRLQVWRVLADNLSVRGALKTLLTARNWKLGSGPGSDRKRGDRVTTAFLEWQRELGDRPFFAFLNYFDAHGPYRSPKPYQTLFGTPDETINLYDGAIAYLDHQVGSLLTELERRRLLDHTIVIITADHGEHFGEHNLTGHANSLYLPLLHVPLIIQYPGKVPAGSRVAQVVSLRDLAATILELSGTKGNLPGNSLVHLWDSVEVRGSSIAMAQVSKRINPDSAFPNSQVPLKAIVEDSFHYIVDGDGREELYAYRSDPAEASNLAATTHGQLRLPLLRARLARILERPDSTSLPGSALRTQ